MNRLRIYTPDDYRKYRLLSNVKDLFRNISNYGTLIRWLVKVGLTQQYKRSFLGVAWLFLSPFFSILLWVLLQASGILNPGDTKIPYVAYVFLSNSIWNFFISFYKSISETYIGRGNELLQNNFPHIIIIVEKIIIATINFTIPLLLSIIVLLIFKTQISWSAFLLPLTLLPIIFVGIGLGLIFSVLKIVALDFTNIFDNSLDIFKFITPVVFASNVGNSTLQTIMKYNPLTYLIDFPRSVLLNLGFPHLYLFLICSAFSLIFLLIAYRFFTISGPVIFEKITL